jgi:hypothetical protein
LEATNVRSYEWTLKAEKNSADFRITYGGHRLSRAEGTFGGVPIRDSSASQRLIYNCIARRPVQKLRLSQFSDFRCSLTKKETATRFMRGSFFFSLKRRLLVYF